MSKRLRQPRLPEEYRQRRKKPPGNKWQPEYKNTSGHKLRQEYLAVGTHTGQKGSLFSVCPAWTLGASTSSRLHLLLAVCSYDLKLLLLQALDLRILQDHFLSKRRHDAPHVLQAG